MDSFTLAVRGASTPEFWFWFIGLVTICAVSARTAILRQRRAHMVEDVPTSRIRSAHQGYVELKGRSELMPGPVITAPLTGIRCCWWTFRVEEKVTTRRSGRSETRWQTISRGTSDEPFLIVDDTGRCVVDPWGAEVLAVTSERWHGSQARPAPAARRQSGGRYRYAEKRLEVGGPLYAIGWFRTERASVDTDSAEEEVRLLLSAWKQDQPALLARFDSNRDGSIDLEEWQHARDTAMDEVSRARHERAVHPGLDILSHPPDGRPFLLAALPQPGIARRQRQFAFGFLLLAIATGTAAAAMLLLRLG